MQSHQTMMNVNANNVANVNSDGFIPKDTKISDNGGSVSANVRSADDSGSKKSQTDLAKELTDQVVVEDATAVNVTAIKTQDEMVGTLLDIKA
jgi:flagellar hook protein FlgE